MEQDKAFLGKEPIGKLLLKLALPTVAAQMINMLYNLVDRIADIIICIAKQFPNIFSAVSLSFFPI